MWDTNTGLLKSWVCQTRHCLSTSSLLRHTLNTLCYIQYTFAETRTFFMLENVVLISRNVHFQHFFLVIRLIIELSGQAGEFTKCHHFTVMHPLITLMIFWYQKSEMSCVMSRYWHDIQTVYCLNSNKPRHLKAGFICFKNIFWVNYDSFWSKTFSQLCLLKLSGTCRVQREILLNSYLMLSLMFRVRKCDENDIKSGCSYLFAHLTGFLAFHTFTCKWFSAVSDSTTWKPSCSIPVPRLRLTVHL